MTIPVKVGKESSPILDHSSRFSKFILQSPIIISSAPNRFFKANIQESFVVKSLSSDGPSLLYQNLFAKHFSFSNPFKVDLSKLLFSVLPTVYAAEAVDTTQELTYKEIKRQKILEMLGKETSHDRLRKMYTLNEFGEVSPEIKYIIKSTLSVFAIGLVLGGLTGSDRSRNRFFRQNAETAFESEYLARRQLYDKMAVGAVSNGFRNGAKMSFTTFIYLMVTMTAASYNNKVTIYEHLAGGALFGGLARINYGLRGMAVAGCLGSFLGMCCGGVVLGLMKLSNITYEEFRYWQYEYYMPEIRDSYEEEMAAREKAQQS